MGPARFGTDGVRGVANDELDRRAGAGPRPCRRPHPARARLRRRPRHPALGAPAPGRLLGRPGHARAPTSSTSACCPRPVSPAVAEARKVPGRRDLGLAQPVRRQRHQALQPAGARKLPADVEAEIERELDSILADPDRPPRRPTGHGVGQIIGGARGRGALRRRTWSPRPKAAASTGLRVVVDCAHGAASEVAPARAGRARAPTSSRCTTTPDGVNINEKCGSTDPGELSPAVVARGADLGLAFDGDADRVIAVDHTGTIVDGDVLLALFAARPGRARAPGRQHRGRDRHDQPRLPPGHGGAGHRRARDRRGRPPRPRPPSTPTG